MKQQLENVYKFHSLSKLTRSTRNQRLDWGERESGRPITSRTAMARASNDQGSSSIIWIFKYFFTNWVWDVGRTDVKNSTPRSCATVFVPSFHIHALISLSLGERVVAPKQGSSTKRRSVKLRQWPSSITGDRILKKSSLSYKVESLTLNLFFNFLFETISKTRSLASALVRRRLMLRYISTEWESLWLEGPTLSGLFSWKKQQNKRQKVECRCSK